jgi:adenylate cyclase
MLYIASQKFKHPHIRPNPLDLAYPHITRALELDPQNQEAHRGLAMYLYLTDLSSFDAFYAAAEEGIAVNPNNSFFLADMGNYITYSGDWERGVALSERARELNPLHGNWMYYPTFLDQYRRGKYQEALNTMLKIGWPNNYVSQTNLAAVYGQLGETEKAWEVIEHIREIHPSFDDDPRFPFVVRRMPKEFVELIMEGLQKVGYDVPPL